LIPKVIYFNENYLIFRRIRKSAEKQRPETETTTESTKAKPKSVELSSEVSSEPKPESEAVGKWTEGRPTERLSATEGTVEPIGRTKELQSEPKGRQSVAEQEAVWKRRR
jgi:hypothetical protein